MAKYSNRDVAIVGVSFRLPGADTIEKLAKLLIAGEKAITRFTPEELNEFGVAESLFQNKLYFPLSGYIDGADQFDAEFFRFTNTEAYVMDPQYRLLFECAYTALENAALLQAIESNTVRVGAFITSGMALYSARGMNSYYHNQIKDNLEIIDKLDPLQISFLNDKDWLSTQLSYRLKLTGPSVNIQTACSSSLVAIHYALQSLRSGECDAALVGGSAIHTPLKSGYLYTEGGLFSGTGSCNPFSDRADGTVGGNGVVAMILCPLEKAIKNHQHIYGVIKGSAINNDGARKVSFTAPSVDGQKENIKKAIEDAGINAADIRYVETHGTATKLGDPIEVAAFTQAFAGFTTHKQFCHIGSLKSNIGHLDTTAGIASVIKCLTLFENKIIPPIAGYGQPNPYIDFVNSPFKVNLDAVEFEQVEGNRLAMVASLGAGGTNAHVVLQDWNNAADLPDIAENQGYYLLPISAKTPEALLNYASQYVEFLQVTTESLVDICYTAAICRLHYPFRLCVEGGTKQELCNALNHFIQSQVLASNLSDLAKFYVNGEAADWVRYWSKQKRKKIILPTYPFQRKRFWVNKIKKEPQALQNFLFRTQWEKYNSQPKALANSQKSKYLLITDGLNEKSLEQVKFIYEDIHVLADKQLDSPEKFAFLLEDKKNTFWKIIYFPVNSDNGLEILSHALDLLQTLQPIADQVSLSLSVITTGAHLIEGYDSIINPVSALLWSFIQSATLETPGYKIFLYDVELQNNAQSIHSVLQDIKDNQDAKCLVYRKTERYIARIEPVTQQNPDLAPYQIDEAALIIGAFGGIGKLLINHLIERQCRHLILIGRRKPDDAFMQVLLADNNLKVDVLIADIQNVKSITVELASRNNITHLKEVYHLAGIVADKTISNMDKNDIAKVLRPKIDGTTLIENLINIYNPQLSILFSSIASIQGAAGQSNYAAANAYLNAFALQRQLQGQNVRSVCFGPWKDVGMAAKLTHIKNTSRSLPTIKPLAAENYFHSLDMLLATKLPVGIIADLDVANFTRQSSAEFMAKQYFMAEIKSWLREELSSLLGIQPTDIDDQVTFNDLNADSLTIIIFAQSVEKKFNLAMSVVTLYNHPNIDKLSKVIDEKLGRINLALMDDVIRPAHTLAEDKNTQNKIAIVGMGCRFANSIQSPAAFWESLKAGKIPVVNIPANRYSLLDSFADNKKITEEIKDTRAGFLEDIYSFDPLFFGITPKETYDLDPQYRLLLETTWEALENAAITLKQAQKSRTGLYMGIGTDDFTHLALQQEQYSHFNNYTITGSNRGIGVGRISYLLGLCGPALAIDTTCSSSLVAVHYATQALLMHEVDLAFAGGVNLILSPFNIIGRKHLGIVSNKNKCKVFDDDADGFVQGEGAGVVLLKRLEDALRDNDNIQAVIVGSAVNQNGGGNGLQAPNGVAQAKLLADSLTKANLTVNDIDFIETHGTGTRLGDPIEVEAIAKVYGVNRPRNQPLLVSSAKASYGHLEPAAGILSLMKTVLCLKHKELIQQQNFVNANTHIDWQNNNVKVITENSKWPQINRVARAGVSSFGINGTNAHLIMEAFSANDAPIISADIEYSLPISAKSEAALRLYIKQYIDYLQNTDEALGDICYTASEGRELYKYSLTVTARDKNTMLSKLKNYSVVDIKIDDIHTNTFADRKYKKVILPGHPYLKKEYMKIEAIDMNHEVASPPVQDEQLLLKQIMHKLRENISELTQISFAECDESATLISLGIDSYIMITLVQRIKEIWGVDMPIRELFESHNRIVKIANYIFQHSSMEKPREVVMPAKVTPVNIMESIAPSTFKVQPIPTFRTESFSFKSTCTAPASLPDELTPAKKAYLNDFINRYNKKTSNSKKCAAESRSYLSNNRKSSSGFRQVTKELNYPIIAKSSHGATIIDIDNNSYIDLSMGFGANLFGHNPGFIKTVLSQQVEIGYQIGPEAEKAAYCAKLIAEFSNKDKVLFTNSGTEAVMTAIRIARAFRKKNKIVVFQNSYHGHFDSTLVNVNLNGETKPEPMCAGVPQSMIEDVILLPYDKQQSLTEIIKYKDSIAAVLVEPVQNRQPGLHPKDFLQKLRTITLQNEISLIFDETLVGFRILAGGAQAWFDVDADLVTYGKIVGGGLPIGVIAGRRDHMDKVDGGMWNYGDQSEPFSDTTYTAGTFCKHPLAMASCAAVLTQIKQQGSELYRILNHRCGELFKIINNIFAQNSVPLKIHYFGSFFRFAQSDNLSFLYQPLELDIFFYHLIEKGIYVWESKTCFISTEHSNDDMNKIIKAVHESVTEMKNAGFWNDAPNAAAPLALKQDVIALNSSLSTHSMSGQFIATKSANTKIDFSLYFFGDYKDYELDNPYTLIMAAAKYADQQGFKAVWLPERHFNSFGGFSPNPAVISSALARETKNICLRASVIMPLQHPARLVEEWSVVQNLSQSKQIGLALTPGWHTNDFVLNPLVWETRKEELYKNITITQELWSGKKYSFIGPNNTPTPTETFPKPEQTNLPLWIATLDNKEVFAKAGESGVGVITNLLGQNVKELKDNIQIYKNARRQHGLNPDTGHVVVLVHTLVCADKEEAIELARKPFCDYLSSSVGLFQKMAKLHNLEANFEKLSADDRDYIINQAYVRLSQGNSLIGDSVSCTELVHELAEIGVSEIACFVDFGMKANLVVDNLQFLNELKNKFKSDNTVKTLPLLKNQLQMLMVEHFDTGAKNINNLTLSFSLQNKIDVPVLQKAYQALINRHAALRVTIEQAVRVQKFHEHLAANLEIIDMRQFDEARKQKAIDTFFADDKNRICDLTVSAHRIILIITDENKSLLVINIHHIISDGISLEVLVNDLTNFYNLQLARIDKDLLLNSCFQYDEYIEAKLATTNNVKSQACYWQKITDNGLPIFEFPTDYTRPSIKTYYGTIKNASIGASIKQSLQNLSKNNDVTNFTVMLAVYAILLSQLTGQRKLVIGVAFSGRTFPGSDNAIGFFSNMYPLVFDIDPASNVKEIVQAARKNILDILENQDYPSSDIIEKSRKTLDLSRNALFDVAFNWDDVVVPQFNGIKTDYHDIEKRYVRNDMMLNIIKINDNLTASLEYNTDLYSAATANKVLQSYLQLLEKVSFSIVAPIATLSLGDSEELSKIDLWNNTARDFQKDICVHQIFENIVDQYPEKAALQFNGEQLSYAQLNKYANQIAHYLQVNTSNKEEIIAICMPRSFELIASILGVLKAGLTYLPCDPTFPDKRIDYMLNNANVKCIIINNSVKHLFINFTGKIINLETIDFIQLPVTNLDLLGNPNAAAYVIYTSGSTGNPKGVARSHRGICNRMLWMWEGAGLSAQDICALQASISVIDSGWEMFGALLKGATLVLYNELYSKSAVEILQQCIKNKVTRLTVVPSLLKELLHNKDLFEQLSINYWQVTGEPIALRYIEELFQLVKNGARVTECYGTTEATSSLFREYFYNQGQVTHKTVQSFNSEIYILDAYLNKLPIGVTGDLYVGGEVLAIGYLNNPSLTAEKFIQNPFAKNNSSSRLYQTGDVAKYLPDGSVVILGRKDNQIKIRGFRVELGEIELVLQRVQQVKDSVVIVHEDAESQKKLVAFITTHDNDVQEDQLIQQLREICRDNLPDFMMPSQIIVLAKMPLTENGKIDKKQLPIPQGREGQLQFEAPQGEIETTIAAIWSSLLKIKAIGRNDNFFELGGDSLLLIQFISKVIKEFKTAVTMVEIYRKQTIREVAEYITEKSSNTLTAKIVTPAQELILGQVPLLPNRFSYFQARLRNLESWYVASPVLQEINSIDTELFKQAIDLLIIYHDGLRLKIENTQTWDQMIAKPETMNVLEIVQYEPAQGMFKDFVESQLNSLGHKISFGTQLFKILYIRGNEANRGVIYILSHHLLLDAFAARIVIHDLFTLYLQLVEKSQITLPAKTTSIKNYAESLLFYLDKVKEEEYAYWKSQPWRKVKSIPLDYPDNIAHNIEGETVNVIEHISVPDTVDFLQMFQSNSINTFNNLLIYAVAKAYKICFGQSILSLGLVFHGREVFIESIDISRTVGWFGEVVPIIIDADDHFENALKNIHSQIQRVGEKGKTFNYLKYMCKDKKIQKGMMTIPAPQISLNVIPPSIEKRNYKNVVKSTNSISAPDWDKATTERVFLISGGAYFSNNKFNISWDFSQKLFAKETIDRFTEITMSQFTQLLNKVKSDQGIDVKFTEMSE